MTTILPPIEALERRRLLAGDVSTLQAGTLLALSGDAAANGVSVTRQRVTDTTSIVRDAGGVTSVALDVDALADDAGLYLRDAEGVGEGNEAFGGEGVGFPIGRSTFTYDRVNGELAGQIRHDGSISFLALGDEPGREATPEDVVNFGEFSIGFDAGRADDNGATGYFIKDQASDLGIVFDLDFTNEPSFQAESVTIEAADLLVSPEFAAFLLDAGLTDADLTGADVGDARVDALANPLPSDLFRVIGLPRDGAATTVSGRDDAIFNANDVDGPPNPDGISDIVIEGNEGRDGVFLADVSVRGLVEVNGGENRDYIGVDGSTIGGGLIVEDSLAEPDDESEDPSDIGDPAQGGGVVVDVFDSVVGGLIFNGSFADDRLQVRESRVTGGLFANFYRGDDTFAAIDSEARNVFADGGRGRIDQLVNVGTMTTRENGFDFEDFEAAFAV